MSGHSKWHQIRHKKGLIDAKRGKIFTRHAKLITIAAQSGGDPSTNARLRSEIDRAKTAGVPAANIDRAIKKGTGELGGDKMAELVYEGYAPGGVAVLIQTLTDNRNRTVQELRLIFSRNGGQLVDSGSVAYLFSKKGLIQADLGTLDSEEAELKAIDAGAEEISLDGTQMVVTTALENLHSAETKLKAAGFTVESAQPAFIPATWVDPGENAEKVRALLEAVEELDDVDEVFSNADLPAEA